ncbi:MAG: hypothetical protein H8E60_00120 [Candidatus Marinimicrobia bacterium]|nr:hypothetical protein [Candidatus Neomarinimicrobiota bacterium]MBL7110241.1 hypothetical protein [Candidatus Neomarinimicrobiota bacterium]
MIKLTPHEQKILDLVKKNPEIIHNPEKRKEIANQEGFTEKTLRNRMGDLKKYGVLPGSEESGSSINTDFDDIDLFRIGQILWSSKFEIIRNVFIVSILSVVLAFMLPKTYRSSAIIMPPVSSNERGIFGSGSGMFALESLLSPTSSSDANTFLAILKSHTIMQSVIEKFNLMEFYNVENSEKAQQSLENDTNFEIDEEGTIRVETYVKTGWFHSDEDEEICKVLSRDITNYFVAKLDIVNKRLKSEKAMQHRMFIENRYNQNIIDLAISEEKLKTYQEINKTVAIPKESNASISVSSEILSRITIQKVRLGMLENTLAETHPEVQILKSEISELEKELSNVPDLVLKLGRLMRDVEVQNILYTFLTQQYEEAKIQEAKDTPTVQVLDYAVLPQLKYKPSRARVCIIGFVLSTVFSMYFYYFRKRWQLSARTINN